MTIKTLLFSIVLITAGILSAAAQNNIPQQERLAGQSLKFESSSEFGNPKLPTIKKANSGQNWWEPDTMFVFFNDPLGGIKRHVFEYQLLPQGLSAIDTLQWWSNNSWETPLLLYTYTYDFNNNLLTKLQQSRDNNSWVNSWLYTYTYNSNNNLLTELWQNWQDNSWVNFISNSYSYTYDSNNNILTKLQQSRDNNSWVNSWLYTYTYNSNNNLLTELWQNWQNNSWVNFISNSYSYTYDSNNNILTKLQQSRDNNSRVNIRLYTYTYDSNNNRLTELDQIWENNSWINDKQYLMTYDENGNNISVERLIWINENWQLSSVGGSTQVSLHLYYNKMQSVFEDWGCDKITASYIKMSDIIAVIEPVATPELSAVSIYPNPTTGELRIKSDELRVENVELFDMTGEKNFNSQFSILNSLDISHLPAGMYFVKITTDKGVVTKKIVKR